MAKYSIFTEFSPETSARLYDNLPDRPYCANNLAHGLKIRTRKTAFQRYAYLQLNKYYATAYLSFDVDRGGAALAWEDADLPAPTFATINPENLHAHLVYELYTPVLLWENARQHPILWLNAIKRAYTESLEADAGYSGLIGKNPNHTRWDILDFRTRYELVELSEAVSVQQRHFIPQKGFREDFAAEGRNNFLFELGRFYAYRKVHQCQSREALNRAVQTHIKNLNITEFPDPLQSNELRHIAKSLATWTWQNRATISGGYKRKTKDAADLRARQAQNALNTNKLRKAATEATIRKAIGAFLKQGRKITKTAIAQEMGVSRQTLNNYKHLFPPKV